MKFVCSLLVALASAASTFAAGEIQINTTTGQTVYFVVWDESGQAWNPNLATPAFATYTTTRGDFDIALTEIGTTGYYVGDFPSTAAGVRRWEIFLDANDDATPSHADDISLATGSGYWNGSSFASNVPTPAEIAAYIWDTFNLTDATTEGSPGKLLKTNLDDQVSQAVSAGTADPTHVDADHTWGFDDERQMTAPNVITEITGSPSILVAMNFSEPLPEQSVIHSITSVSFEDLPQETEPTVVASTIHTAKRKVNIELNTESATAATHTCLVKILTTDGQTITRRGRLDLQTP